MAYASWSVVFGEQPSAAKWNILGTNDSSFNDGTGIGDSAILPKHLLTGTGSTWPWQNWTPTWTNLTAGNGTMTYSKYAQIGKTIHFRLHFIFGSTTSVSNTIIFSTPVTMHADYADFTKAYLGTAQLRDSSAATTIFGTPVPNNTTTASILPFVASGTATSAQNTSATVPFAWAVSDIISVSGTYEAA